MKVKRKKGRSCFLGALLITFCLLNLPQSVHAHVPVAEAHRTYFVPFSEWVERFSNHSPEKSSVSEFSIFCAVYDDLIVFLHVMFSTPSTDYFIGATAKAINNRIRFIIQGYYLNTEMGRKWYRNYGSHFELIIASLCQMWTQQGYPIGLNDFEIHIEKLMNYE
jgi:hypothetical protein